MTKEAFKDLTPDTFVEGLGAFCAVDMEDGGEDS